MSRPTEQPAEGWAYEVRDAGTGKVLLRASGFRTEADARTQAEMEVALYNVKGCSIHTMPHKI